MMEQSTNAQNTKEKSEWLTRLKEICAIAGTLSAAAGIVASSYTYVVTQWAKNDEIQRAQLSTFSTYGQYLKRYQDYIQPALGRLMQNKERIALDKAMRAEDQSVCKTILGRTTTGTGFEAFTSSAMKDARQVHNFYESIGYGLERGQLSFEIIFGLITVPSYWNIQNPSSDWYTKKSQSLKGHIPYTYIYPDFNVLLPLRSCLGASFFGRNMPLSDFSDSVDRLGYNYLFARMKYLYSRGCRNGKAGDRDSGVFIESPDGKTWPEPVLDHACATLRTRINAMSSSSEAPKSWMRLYPGNSNTIDPELTVLGRPLNIIY
jgi:hypothetical protein